MSGLLAIRSSAMPWFLVLLAASLSMSCDEDRLVDTPCEEDSHCPSGYLCDAFRCVPAESKSCEVVIDGNPILQPSPYAVSFGELDTPEATQRVALHNIGTCTLTLYEASLGLGAESAFGCEACASGFPLEIFPGRSRELDIAFKAKAVGQVSDELVILSDDRDFPELRVPLHAKFLGVPDLRVAPNPVDFGYVAQGRQAVKAIQISNQGTGTASIVVESVTFEPSTQDFSLSLAPTEPVTLAPAESDPEAVLALQLQYHPRSTAKHQVELRVKTSKGEVRVPVSGNAETPPKLAFSPAAIDLGRVPLGQTNAKPLTLVNEGGAPLQIQYTWGGPKPSTDLFATPTVIPSIAAGQYVELQVAFTATAVGPVSGLLVLSSNDPSRPSLTIPVSAEGIPGPGPAVVKLEMTYENGSDSAFDEDLRNVDMSLEHPYGYVCNKEYPSPANWGSYGSPTWISFGAKEEPERIVLADAQQDGTYRVMLQYAEDCASLPTELAAGVLGISVDALIAYLTGGAGTGVIDGGDLAEMIQNLCLDHRNTNVTVRAFVNGALINEKTVTLGKKGETTYVLDLVRSGGTFSAQ
ncbi:MAG: choice-of-anchor D domain-containing protein [Myxococcaceae bacterium]